MQKSQNSKLPEFVHWARFDEAGRPTEMGTIDDFNRLPKDQGYVQITEEQAKNIRKTVHIVLSLVVQKKLYLSRLMKRLANCLLSVSKLLKKALPTMANNTP